MITRLRRLFAVAAALFTTLTLHAAEPGKPLLTWPDQSPQGWEKSAPESASIPFAQLGAEAASSITATKDGPLTLRLANPTGLSSALSTSLRFGGQSYTIDKSPPTVVSVTRHTPSGQNTNATTHTFRVICSEAVTLNAPATSHFQVVPVNGTNIVGTMQSVTGSGGTRDVTVNLTSGTGEFRLRVLD